MPSEKEVIEDLIVAAIADAQIKASAREKEDGHGCCKRWLWHMHACACAIMEPRNYTDNKTPS